MEILSQLPDSIKFRVLEAVDKRPIRKIDSEGVGTLNGLSEFLSQSTLKDLIDPKNKSAPFYIIDNCVKNVETVRKGVEEAKLLKNEGKLTPAAIGAKDSHEDRSVRGDVRCWIRKEPQDNLPALTELSKMIDTIAQQLASTPFERSEMQLTCYGAGQAGYVPHMDSHADNDRFITIILYFNKDYKESEGGQLRMLLNDEIIEISPIENRLIVFRSDQIEHCVLPSNFDRYAISCWFSLKT